MSPSIHALEHLFSAESDTQEERRELLGLLERLLASRADLEPSALADDWERASTLDDGRRVDPRELPARGESLDAVVEQLRYLTKDCASGLGLPGLLGAVATVLASGGSGLSEEAPPVDEAESRVVAMLSRVVGYDERWSRGRTTWSSRAAVLAGLRVAISKQAPESRRKGVPRNLYCFASEAAGEDAVLEAVETTGIGGYHLIRVRRRADGTMDPEDLREKMLAVITGGDVPAFVVASIGAEGVSALDDVKELREVVDSLTTLYGLRPVHLHADAAWGGLYSVFNGYDFHGNPLGFEPPVVEALLRIRTRVRHLHLADSVGLDFRWPERAAYPAGLFLLRNGADLRLVGLRSLEGASALALHAQLRAFGLEGYRRLLADSLRGERVAGGGPEVDVPGVAVGSEARRRGGPVEAVGPSSRMAPEVVAFSGMRSSLARPRN